MATVSFGFCSPVCFISSISFCVSVWIAIACTCMSFFCVQNGPVFYIIYVFVIAAFDMSALNAILSLLSVYKMAPFVLYNLCLCYCCFCVRVF